MNIPANLDKFLRIATGITKYDGQSNQLEIKGEKEKVTQNVAFQMLADSYKRLSKEELNHPKTQKKIFRLLTTPRLVENATLSDKLENIFGSELLIQSVEKLLEEKPFKADRNSFEFLLSLFGGDSKKEKHYDLGDFVYTVRKSSKGDVVTIGQFSKKVATDFIYYRLYIREDGVVVGKLLNDKLEEVDPPIFETPLSEILPDTVFAIGKKIIEFGSPSGEKEKVEQAPTVKKNSDHFETLMKLFGGDATQEKKHEVEGFSYMIRKSSKGDIVTIGQYTKEMIIYYRLYTKDDGTVVGVALDDDQQELDPPIFEIQISEITVEKVLKLGSEKLGQKNDQFKKKAETLEDAHNLQLFASLKFEINAIRSKALKLGLDPSNKVGDYREDSYKLIRKLINHFGLSHKIVYNDNMQVQELLEKIEEYRDHGTSPKKSFKAMAFLINSLEEKGIIKEKDRAFFDIYVQRFNTQKQLYKQLKKLRQLAKDKKNSPENLKNYNEICETQAKEILKQVHDVQHEELGIFLYSGFAKHGIDVEISFKEGKYQFNIANAGSQSRDNHRAVSKAPKKVISIKSYEAGTSEVAQEIIGKLLDLKADPSSKGKDFYPIFSKATVVEDYSIPPRPCQRTGNCTVRSQQELLYYTCQRTGRVDLANAIQDSLQEKIKEQAELIEKDFPGLKEEMNLRGKKPKIKPLIKGQSELTLMSLKDNSKHIIPIGPKIITSLDQDGKMEISDGTIELSKIGFFKERKGKACIGLYPNFLNASFTLTRKGRSFEYNDYKKRVKVKKDDIITFGKEGRGFIVL